MFELIKEYDAMHAYSTLELQQDNEQKISMLCVIIRCVAL